MITQFKCICGEVTPFNDYYIKLLKEDIRCGAVNGGLRCRKCGSNKLTICGKDKQVQKVMMRDKKTTR